MKETVRSVQIKKRFPKEGECSRFCDFEIIEGVEWLTVKFGKRYCRITVEELMSAIEQARKNT